MNDDEDRRGDDGRYKPFPIRVWTEPIDHATTAVIASCTSVRSGELWGVAAFEMVTSGFARRRGHVREVGERLISRQVGFRPYRHRHLRRMAVMDRETGNWTWLEP